MRFVDGQLVALLTLAITLSTGVEGLQLPDPVKRQNFQAPPAPTNYAPFVAACPPAPSSGGQGLLRDASTQTLNPDEAAWIDKHQQATQQAWKTWLTAAAPGADLNGKGGLKGGVERYLNDISHVPRVGIAISGGSFRSMLLGAGIVQALDGRNDTATKRGTGGFLQLASHISGLSGGSWTVGSLAMNDWPTIQSLQDSLWGLETGFLVPPNGDLVQFRLSTVNDARDKVRAGAAVSLIDLWGRQLASHFLGSTYPDYGKTAQWTDIVKTKSFTSATYPFPLVTTLTHINGSPGSGGNGTVIEHNPYETGTYDANVAAFVPTSIFGTPMNNGEAQASGSSCVYGISNAGYVMGLSSAIFNQAQEALPNALLQPVLAVFRVIAGDIVSQISNSFTQIYNPFKGYKSGPLSAPDNITLVDGGEDGQVMPLAPLVQPARKLDMILAIDGGGDTNTQWPAGYGLTATQSRYTTRAATFGKIPFPKIPSAETIAANALNTRPTFFGCDSARDVNNADAGQAPIIVYLANYPWVTASNISTGAVSVGKKDSQALIDNGFALGSLGGAPNWPTCLACASLQRSFERSSTARPQVCDQCMDLYCWNSNTPAADPSKVNRNYAPPVGTPAWVAQNASKITRVGDPNAGGGSSSGSSSGGSGGSSTSSSGGTGGKNGQLGAVQVPQAILALSTVTSMLLFTMFI